MIYDDLDKYTLKVIRRVGYYAEEETVIISLEELYQALQDRLEYDTSQGGNNNETND